MVAAREHFPKLTPAEYLEWEELRNIKGSHSLKWMSDIILNIPCA